MNTMVAAIPVGGRQCNHLSARVHHMTTTPIRPDYCTDIKHGNMCALLANHDGPHRTFTDNIGNPAREW